MNNHHSFQSPLEGESTIFYQLGSFLNPPLALLGVGLKNFQVNKICHVANHPYLCKGLISILFLYFNSALAFAPHTANYQLSINGLKIAEEVRTLHQINDQYFYTANAETSGMAALIKDYSIAASATFTTNNQGVAGVNYQIIEQEDGVFSKNYVINIYSENKTVISALTKNQPKVVVWEAQPGNIVDPLSLFLALSYDLESKPEQTKFSYQVADGKSVEQQHFQKTENQTIRINNQTFDAIRVDRINQDDNNMQAYFLSEYRYLPVIIKQTKGTKKYRYEIKDFKISEVRDFKTSEVKKLQVVF